MNVCFLWRILSTTYGRATLIVGFLVLSLAARDARGGEKMTLAELRAERKKAAHRTRRIIFNNDGNEPVYYLDEATEEAFLACRTTPLVGSQVDAIFYCTWSSGFGYFTHDTQVGEVFDCTANPKHKANKRGGFSKNKTAEFIRQGTDPLEMMVRFGKRHDIEVFWSFRMNDTHDAWGGWYSPCLFPPLKKEHSEWLLGTKNKRPTHGGWSAVDYGEKQIRDLAVAFIEEVCQNYDVDGIEMDFLRHPMFFRKPAYGQDAGQAELDQMTSMLRRVREVTEREGLRRGRPFLVAVRVPDSVDYCKAMGLDIERWLKEGLIDLMAVSGYFRLNPWARSVELGHKYDVPVYPCLSESRMRGAAGKVRKSLACYRARAMNVWAAGADGVYLFNFFNPRSALWRQAGSVETMAGLDKVYCPGARGVRAINRWMARGEKRFLNRPSLSPERPVSLPPGKTHEVPLQVGEPVEQWGKGLPVPAVTLRLSVRQLKRAADLAVTVNDTDLNHGSLVDGHVVFAVPPDALVQGANAIALRLHGDAEEVVLDDLLLWMRYEASR
jgi:hypothetical protein